MIDSSFLYSLLEQKDISFFCGVPDSLLKDFLAYVQDTAKDHVITANEGAAIALASGYHLSTGKIPFVYMQNSGQGNCVNPLTSLTDPEVYSIPMILFIGWRGQPGVKDEPQHRKQGRICLPLLETLEIPYSVLPQEQHEVEQVLEKAITTAKETSSPYAIVVSKGTFEKYTLQDKSENNYSLSREEAIRYLEGKLQPEDIVISTTGKPSRELYEIREKKGGLGKDFLTVGSMGHASQIALGVALQKPERTIYCFDGDGAALMHMGSFGVIGAQQPKNFKHVILNNGAHDSVGGQPTVGFTIDFCTVAQGCGYTKTFCATSQEELEQMYPEFVSLPGPVLLEIRVKKGARSDLGRPKTTPLENKQGFMNHVGVNL